MPDLKTHSEHQNHPQARLIPWPAWKNEPFHNHAYPSELQRTQGDLAAASILRTPGELILRSLLCLLYGHHDAPSQQLLDAARAMGCSDATILFAEACSGIPLLADTLTQPLQPQLNVILPTAWYHAVQNGHLHTLVRLEALMDDKDKAAARKLNGYWAAQNGHFDVLNYIDSQMDAREKAACLSGRIHYLYRIVAENGYLRILQHLERDMSPQNKWEARSASQYHAYRFAAQNGHLDVLMHLEAQMSQEEKIAARKACSYDAWRSAARNGHFNVLKHLEAQMDDMERAAACNAFTHYAFQNAFKNEHHEIANHLLHHAETFAYACFHGYNNTLAFATKTVNQWRLEKEIHLSKASLKPFVLSHPEEDRLAVEILRYRLRENTEEARQDVEFLLAFPGIVASLWSKVDDRKKTCELLIIAHKQGYKSVVSELIQSAPTHIDLSGVDFSTMNINSFLTFLDALKNLPEPTTIDFTKCKGLAELFNARVEIADEQGIIRKVPVLGEILKAIRETQLTKLTFDFTFEKRHAQLVAVLANVIQNNQKASTSLFSTLLGTVNLGTDLNTFFQPVASSVDEVSCGPILDSGWVPGT